MGQIARITVDESSILYVKNILIFMPKPFKIKHINNVIVDVFAD